MRNKLRMCLKYNYLSGKYKLKQLSLLLVLYTFLFFILHRLNIQINLSSMDMFVMANGGYNIGGISIIEMMFCAFPYISIAYLVEHYMNHMMDKNTIFILGRIGSTRFYMLMNLLFILIFSWISVLCFSFINYFLCTILYQGTAINEAYLAYVESEFSSVFELQVKLLPYQIIGITNLSFMQLCLQRISKKAMLGFIAVILIYVLNFNIDVFKHLRYGIYITIYNLRIMGNDGISFLSFGIMNLVYFILLFCVLMKKAPYYR